MENLLVDWSRLDSIADPEDPSDQEWLKDMIRNLYENMETRIQNVQTFMNQVDKENLRAELHQIKGVAANFGLMELFHITKEGERCLKEGNWEEGIQFANQIENIWKETKKTLQSKYP